MKNKVIKEYLVYNCFGVEIKIYKILRIYNSNIYQNQTIIRKRMFS